MIGEGDLGQELGYPRQYEHPELLKWMKRVVDTCKKHNVVISIDHTRRWRPLWRCTGQYANLSIFAVEGNEQLHQILWGLPLFPYMSIAITPLAGHPSNIAVDEAGAGAF